MMFRREDNLMLDNMFENRGDIESDLIYEARREMSEIRIFLWEG